MEIIRDLADGLKHGDLDRNHLQLKHSGEHKGGFSSGFSKGFNTSCLYLTLKDGSKLDFEDVADKVFNYWKDYLTKTGKI